MVTEQVWKGYLETGSVPTGIVDPVILESWNRCRNYGLDPILKPKVKHLKEIDLAERKLTKSRVLRASRSVTASLLKTLQIKNILFVVADEEGYILDINGDIMVFNQVQELGLVIGANWHERNKGSNGIGTALATLDTIKVCGFDHYFKEFHHLTWHSSPIFDGAGNLNGVLSLIYLGKEVRDDLSSIICLAAQNIQLQIAEISRFGEMRTASEITNYLLESSPHAIIMLDKNGAIQFFNHTSEKLLGVKGNEVTGKFIWGIGDLATDGPFGLQSYLMRCLQTGEQIINVGQTLRDKFCQTIQCQLSVFPLKNHFDQVTGVIGVIRNSSLHGRNSLEFNQYPITPHCQNTIDNLTRLHNRKFFYEKLEELIGKSRKKDNKEDLALLILDIDHFKHYNEVMGYETGDKLLVELGGLLKKACRGRDVVARYGGEEFSLILSGADQEVALKVANRIKNIIEGYPFAGREVQPGGKVSVSIGMASYPSSADSKDELIKAAESALYEAQRTRQNKISFYFTVFDELKEELTHSDLSLLNTIRTLITVINAKDRYTYGHSERVVQYATELAKEIKLPQEVIKFLRYGAYLHDIGKIEISRDILNKKEPLKKSEWEVLRNHPQWGAEIIKPVSALRQILPQILYHHERWDGRGYPEGIAGEAIPLTSRILTIADCFDAMTTDRPYQKAISVDKAICQLEKDSGSLFDPKLVEEFIKIAREIYHKIHC